MASPFQSSGMSTALLSSSPAPQATPPTDQPNQTGQQVSRSAQLPATIDPTVAAASFRSQREGLLKLIRHCLPSLANSLYAQFLIPQDVYEEVTDKNAGKAERSVALLDCVETRSEAVPSDFIKIVRVLESEPYLESLASQLVLSYLAFSSTPCSQPVLSTVISHYSSYLKSVYKKSPIYSVNKWPPTPSKKYIQLAVVEGQEKCRDQYIGHILEGNVGKVLHYRKAISVEQILEPCSEDEGKKLILIEGAPGIGKSTLAWELCRKWDEFPCMKQYNLVILLRLREKRVQKMTQVSDLFFSSAYQESLASEVSRGHGDGVLFVLDGFDELRVSLQCEGFIMDLINKIVLPESTVVVTSRPSATAELLTSSHPLIQKHIEILGFTQKSVEAYAASVFSNHDELENFKSYISASKNPAINSLMYVPFNAAIIVQIYKSNLKGALPRTLTELYTQLCLTILNKYMKLKYPSAHICKFDNLPDDLYEQFLELSKVAFEGMVNQQVIFHNDLVPLNLNHFGFLDEVSTLYGGGEVSYNFLHLTIQEFFAAYHISKLPDQGVALFTMHGEDDKWNVVWRFVAGLTKFHYLNIHAGSSAFSKKSFNGLQLTIFLIQCLFESKIELDFKSIFGTETGLVSTYSELSPLDHFATGYCIANCSSKASYWSVSCCGSVQFIQGLMTNESFTIRQGGIKELTLRYEYSFDSFDFEDEMLTSDIELFEDYMSLCATEVASPLSTITSLSIFPSNIGWFMHHTKLFISKIITQLVSLKKLVFGVELASNLAALTPHYVDESLLALLQQLHDSSVTSLDVTNTGINFSLKYSFNIHSAFQDLMHPSSGTLRELKIGQSYLDSSELERMHGIDELVAVASSPSSLTHLSVWYIPLSAFNTNNYLSNLKVVYRSHQLLNWSHLVEDVVRILKCSKTLQRLHVGNFRILDKFDIIKTIVIALKTNSTLQVLKLHYDDDSSLHAVEDLKVIIRELDTRAELVGAKLLRDSPY